MKRSASVGAEPVKKPLARTPADTPASLQPEVRCACQYYQCDSLLPDRINPVGMQSAKQPQQSSGNGIAKSEVIHHEKGCPHAKMAPEPVQQTDFSNRRFSTMYQTFPRSARSESGEIQKRIDETKLSRSSLLLRKYRPQSEHRESPHLEHYSLSRGESRARSVLGSRRSVDRVPLWRQRSEEPRLEYENEDERDLEVEESRPTEEEQAHEEQERHIVGPEEVKPLILPPPQPKEPPKPLMLHIEPLSESTFDRRVVSSFSNFQSNVTETELKEIPFSAPPDLSKSSPPEFFQPTLPTPPKPTPSEPPSLIESLRQTADLPVKILAPKAFDPAPKEEPFRLTDSHDRMEHYNTTLPRGANRRSLSQSRTMSADSPATSTAAKDQRFVSQQSLTSKMRISQPDLAPLQGLTPKVDFRSLPRSTQPPPPQPSMVEARSSSLGRNKSSSFLRRYEERPADVPDSEKRAESETPSVTVVRSKPLDDSTIRRSKLLRRYSKEISVEPQDVGGIAAEGKSDGVFQGQKAHKVGDHYYEPIGPPQEELDQTAVEPSSEAHKRKAETDTKSLESKKKPKENEEFDAAQQFQDQLESQFFSGGSGGASKSASAEPKRSILKKKEENSKQGSSSSTPAVAPIAADEDKKEKKSFLTSTQEHTKSLGRKISSQADKLKTKFNSLRKPKEETEETTSGEVTQVEVRHEVARVESEPVLTLEHSTTSGRQPSPVPKIEVTPVTPEDEHAPEDSMKRKRFQKPDFSKIKMPELKKPRMPKGAKARIDKLKAMKRPSFEHMNFSERFNKLKRSKSLKEGASVELNEETVETRSVGTPKKPVEAEFRTYPRMFSKVRKEKIVPAQDGKPKMIMVESIEISRPAFSSEMDLERETSVERRMRVHLEKAIEDYRKQEEEDKKADVVEAKPPRKPKLEPSAPPVQHEYYDFNQNKLQQQNSDEKRSLEEIETLIRRSEARPVLRQESQSLQSSDRPGVLEEIDDDLLFLRKKGISEDNIQMGEYISSAIREGLNDPVNVLAQMSYANEDEMRFLEGYRGKGESDSLLDAGSLDKEVAYYNTHPAPPRKPARRKKEGSETASFRDSQEWMGRGESAADVSLRDIDQDSVDLRSISVSISFSNTVAAVPPTPPRRRKKRMTKKLDMLAKDFEAADSIPYHREVIVERKQMPPLAKGEDEAFTPAATPRRSRSVSLSDHTSHGAQSNILDSMEAIEQPVEPPKKEVPGYATVKKEPPPRPPLPAVRKKSTKSLGATPFATMPHQANDQEPPPRPVRAYSTIVPDRPARRSASLTDTPRRRRNDSAPYEEIDDQVHRNLQSGDVVGKMKDRPLPPPPRPPRARRQSSKKTDDRDEDGGAERVRIGDWRQSSSQDSYTRVEEIDIAVQTDALPDDFILEDFEITDDMRTVTPTKFRYLVRDQEQVVESSETKPESRSSSRPLTPSITVQPPEPPRPVEIQEGSLSFEQVELEYDSEGQLAVTKALESLLAQVAQGDAIPEHIETYEEEKESTPPVPPARRKSKTPLTSEPTPPRTSDLTPPRTLIEEAPVPPTRRRSSSKTEDTQKIVAQLAPNQLETQTPGGTLHLANLEIDRLSVGDLTASRLTVSELESSSVRTQELESKSGSLSVQSIELPPGLIEEIVDRVSRAQQQSAAPSPTPQPPADAESQRSEQSQQRPLQFVAPADMVQLSIPPSAFFQLRNPGEETATAPPRRRRHLQTTSSEEESNSPTRHRHRPSIPKLTGQLARACTSAVADSGRQFMAFLRACSKDERRRDLHFVLFLLLVIIAGLFLLSMDNKDIHHHHWDYFNPPGNGQQQQQPPPT